MPVDRDALRGDPRPVRSTREGAYENRFPTSAEEPKSVNASTPQPGLGSIGMHAYLAILSYGVDRAIMNEIAHLCRRYTVSATRARVLP
jgi:hypothetical protein